MLVNTVLTKVLLETFIGTDLSELKANFELLVSTGVHFF
jgi:hypothetical protein